jgi:hypothetical protein
LPPNIEVVNKAGVSEEKYETVFRALAMAVRNVAADASYIKSVRGMILASVTEELKNRKEMVLRTTLTENVKAAFSTLDPRIVEVLIPASKIPASSELWRLEGALAHEIAEVRLCIEEEFSWRAPRLLFLAPSYATHIEDAARERLTDVRICLKGYSGYVYHVFLEDVPTIASEVGESPFIDPILLKIIVLCGDKSVSLQLAGQNVLGEHAYSVLRSELSRHNSKLSESYHSFRKNLIASGEISPFSIEQALISTT